MLVTCDFHSRLYNQELEKSVQMSQTLGVGIGAFQGLSNMALNGKVLQVTLGVGIGAFQGLSNMALNGKVLQVTS